MRITKERIITTVMISILAAVFLAVPVCAEESEDLADVDGVIILEKATDFPAPSEEDIAADTGDRYQENEITPDTGTAYSGTITASQLISDDMTDSTLVLNGDTTLILDTDINLTRIDCDNHMLTIQGDKTLRLSPYQYGYEAIEDPSVFTLESGTVDVLNTYDRSEGISSSHSGTNQVIINGGKFITRNSQYGIDVSGDVTINGGTVDLTVSSYGIVSYSNLKITGGTISIQPYDTSSYLMHGLSTCGQEYHQTYGGMTITGGNINCQGSVRSDVNGIFIGGNTNITINSREEGHEAIYLFPDNDEETITVNGTITKPAGGKVKKVLSINAYMYTITAGEKGAEEVVINCQQKPSLENAVITGIEDRTYTGVAIEQSAVVSLGGKVLQMGSDYIVTYKNNVNAGKATVTFTGKGNYEGTVSRQFTINKADRTITASNAEKTYGDQPFSLGAKLSNEGKLSYTSEKTSVITVDDSGKATVKGAGSATIVISSEATENYKAVSKKITVTVKPAAISKVSVVKIKDKTYTGKALKPAPTVTFNGKTLKSGRDYAATYTNNKNAGTAKITLTGKGNYKGSLKTTFRIKKAAISVKTNKITLKASDIKNKNKSYSAGKVFDITKNSGAVTYKKTKGTDKITISKKGKVTVKQGLKKGTYTVKVKVEAAGDKNHTKATRTVSLKVVIK